MNSDELEIVNAALSVMVNGPTSLPDALATVPELAGLRGSLSEDDLFTHLACASPDDPIRNLLRRSLVSWDYVVASGWTKDTVRNTPERRQLIYQRLCLREQFADVMDRVLPFAPSDPVIVVSEKFRRWYTPDRKEARSYYWDVYRKYLSEVRGFHPENVEALGDATDAVVERLTDPEQKDVYQSKGLVVGHVQSGKTANFTGVIAKALDAGYRLVIILSGTTNMLRNQTQRRIDMELIGKEQILRHVAEGERHDYDDDPAWTRSFLSHGALPTELGAFDILRLTGAGQNKGSIGDYRSLQAGIQTLEIEKADKARPLFDPVNLHRANARLMIVKKESSRLKSLVRDLGRIGANALSEIPALIIDDESDQASINTIKPDKAFWKREQKRRTTINGHLVALLKLLPRAQYVGYTATPFANVFVDPADAADIFPKDFVVSLEPPVGYMGVADFHDLEPVSKPTPANSNERAYVRSVRKPHDQSTDELVRAIDSFVLAGAVKLYRAKCGTNHDFRHHTMLVHESVRQSEHAELAELIRKLWAEAGYDGGDGINRLRALLREDFLPVSKARAPELPSPPTIEDIRGELGATVRAIDDGGGPVLIVNGADQAETPDFDKIKVWKIIVGGSLLSRGYTVEGLTVSYFRRRATYQDTLMQMGRWFGFRPGYKDLVRLYIGRHEPMTSARRRFIDLYEAFGSICRDEQEFRKQLKRYAMPEDGSEPLTPSQVPPLVINSHPELMPVGRNRMFNARLVSRNFGGEWIERTLVSDVMEDLQANSLLFGDLLSKSSLEHDEFRTKSTFGTATARGYAGIANHQAVLDVLKKYRWAEPDTSSLMHLEIEFFEGASGDPEIDDWIIYVPQVNSRRANWSVGGYDLATVERSRVGQRRFKAFTEPRHRRVAEVLTGILDGQAISPVAAELAQKRRRGALILYPTYPPKSDDPAWPDGLPALGFALLPPANRLPRRLAFAPRNHNQPEDVTIPVS